MFNEFIKLNSVSILWLTKTLFESLYYSDKNIFKNINYLIIGGEALNKATVNRLIKSATKPKYFLNGYGPTESTTFTCTHNLNDHIEGINVPIGKPIKNRSAYVLDPNMNPVPVGVVGELHIGGAGLARGYLNNKELTDQRFVPNPFATKADKSKGYGRLYKTGDLVRWLPDGNLEYIGRNDQQVKIRGYRIELGEIEHALSQVDGIKQCCAVAAERETESGKAKYLAAYYVADGDMPPPDQDGILDRLSRVLPEYMLPSVLVPMEALPLTINGKLDRKALPVPELGPSEEEYVAPATEMQAALCNVWQEVLGVEKVGITDDFFRIGGDSIMAIRASHLMSKALGREIKVADVFKSISIDALLKNVFPKEFNDGVEWKF
jgi:acyl-coenzyme A synthetase/AMP-(fatty) acid ligase